MHVGHRFALIIWILTFSAWAPSQDDIKSAKNNFGFSANNKSQVDFSGFRGFHGFRAALEI